MFKTLVFLTKVLISASIILWLLSLRDPITLSWQDYEINAALGIVMLVSVLILTGLVYIALGLKNLTDIPQKMAENKRIGDMYKGQSQMSRALTALSLHDSKAAEKAIKRARKYMPNNPAMITVLEGMSAKQRGDVAASDTALYKLYEHEETRVLGLKGLLKSKIERGDDSEALTMAQQAVSDYPKNKELWDTLFTLQVRRGLWNHALHTLDKRKRKKFISKDTAKADSKAIYMALSQDADQEKQTLTYADKAYDIDPGFTPAAQVLIQSALKDGKRRKALSLFKASWRVTPHPALIPYWKQLAPSSAFKQDKKMLRWFEDLVALNPDSIYAQLTIGHVCLDMQLFGQARAYFMRAKDILPVAEVYEALARLEEVEHDDTAAAKNWTAQIRLAEPGMGWVCTETGRHYAEWSPLAMPHRSFNTIQWVDMGEFSIERDIPLDRNLTRLSLLG